MFIFFIISDVMLLFNFTFIIPLIFLRYSSGFENMQEKTLEFKILFKNELFSIFPSLLMTFASSTFSFFR